MKRSFRLSRRANRDVEAVREWYDKQDAGLGNQFLDDLNATFSIICERPKSFPQVKPGIRATRCSRFPYRIYFEVFADRIDILAVYHTARNPRRWNDPDRE